MWISNVVRMTLRPRPQIEVRSWDVGGGRRAAVVRVDPVAEPPCVTTGGQLYERVSGETIPVRDSADVRALYERGRAATERAEANALRALDAAVVGALAGEGPVLILALAVAPVGTARDIAAQVFAPDSEERLLEAAAGLPHSPLFPEYGHPQDRVPVVRVTQDAVSFETTPEHVHSWRLRVAWDGSVVGLLRVKPRRQVDGEVLIPDEESILADALFNDGLRPVALVVEEAARRVGGFGRAHIVVRLIAWRFALRHGALLRRIPDQSCSARSSDGPKASHRSTNNSSMA